MLIFLSKGLGTVTQNVIKAWAQAMEADKQQEFKAM